MATKANAHPVISNGILPRVADIMGIVDTTEDDAFLLEKGCIMDLFQIPCKDLNAAKEYDVEYDMVNFIWLYKSYTGDVKYVSMNYPVDVYEQVQYIERLEARTNNPVFLEELGLEKYWLNYAHDNFAAQEYYIMTFSADAETYRRDVNRLLSHLGRNGQVQKLRLGKKIQIFSKMENMNTALTIMPETKSIRRGIPEGKKYNPYLLGLIQPQGGASFRDERYIKKGDGYEACIHVYGFPKSVNFNWLALFSSFENTISTIDIAGTDRAKTIENINKSIEEQRSRYADARYETEKFDARRVYQQLEQLHEEIVAAGEVVKRIHIRIFTFARTVQQLDEQIGKIISEVESNGYRSGIFLDECSYEWRSLLYSATMQDALPNGRNGKELPSETLALGHPFHFSSLQDRLGTYWGYTKTGGTVIYDPYHKDNMRVSYSAIALGVQRAGKSTFLKLRIRKDIIAGNKVRGFSTNAEFDKLIKRLGGIIINLDGSEGFLNILHVYKTDPKEAASYIKHIEKVCQFYKYLVPEATQYDLMTLQEILRILYAQHMGYDVFENQTSQITGRDATEYPILADLLSTIQSLMYSSVEKKTKRPTLSAEALSRYEKLELAFTTLVKNMGHIFNGHSSIREFEKEQLVFFNVAGLMKLSPQVFDAQVSNAMNLLWDNMLAVGEPQKIQYDEGNLKIEDAEKYIIYMDEAHNFINARKLDSVAFMDRYIRESPKYFAALVLATHKINDFFPTNSSAAGIDAMTNLFSLSQYKLLFKQSADSIPLLQQAFGGELPGRDLEDIHMFEPGECLLTVSGVSCIRFQVEVTERDLQMFAGGA